MMNIFRFDQETILQRVFTSRYILKRMFGAGENGSESVHREINVAKLIVMNLSSVPGERDRERET